MGNVTKTFGLVALISAVANPALSQDDFKLKSATITYVIPDGDDKDTDTAVDVFIFTKFNKDFDLKIASLTKFGSGNAWEDDGAHSYDYDLKPAAVPLSRINDVKVKMTWHPRGKDRCYFKYRLTLVFDDDDPATEPLELTQSGAKVYEISENISELSLP